MHTYIYSVRREARAHVATRAARSSCMWHLRVCALVESLPWGAASLTDLKVTEAPEARVRDDNARFLFESCRAHLPSDDCFKALSVWCQEGEGMSLDLR